MNEPEWCALCADAPAVGRLFPVVYLTQDEVKSERPLPRHETRCCARCGNQASDSFVDENFETGRMAVLQFEHDDFAKVSEKRILELVGQLENAQCSLCGKKMENDPDAMPARPLAEKLLREHPNMKYVTAVCADCAPSCPCCDEEENN